MTPLRRAVALSLFLGAVSLIAAAMTHFALTDIWHGEGDLTLEWSVVRAAFIVIVLFQVSALVTLGRVFRVIR